MIKSLLESWSRYLLLELDYNEIKLKLDGDKFSNSAKYYGVSPEEAKNSIMKTLILNPSTGQELDISDQDKANYLSWRIKQFMTKGSYQGPQPSSIEAFYQIKAQKLDRFLAKNDINRFESVEEFEKIVKDASVGYESYIAEKAKASRKGNLIKLPSGASFEIPDEAKLIIDDPNWLVYTPETRGAAVGLGLYTKWCTAAPGLKYYDTYHKPKSGDPLLVFISKNEKIPTEVILSTRIEQKTDKIGRVRKIKHHTKGIRDFPVRYQFSFGMQQYMNVDDRTIRDSKVFYHLINLLMRNKEKLSKFINKKVSEIYANTESLPDGGTKEFKETPTSKITIYRNSEGDIHREDGPAKIVQNSNGTIDQEWYLNGKKHRDDAPAEITQGKNTYFEKWLQHGVINRDDGPAYIDDSPATKHEKWYKNGKEMRTKTLYKGDGRVAEHFFEETPEAGQDQWNIWKWTKLTGPVMTIKDKDGNIIYERYFINGKEYTAREYFNKLRRMGVKLPEPYYSRYLSKLDPKARQIHLNKDQKVKATPTEATPQEFKFDFGDL